MGLRQQFSTVIYSWDGSLSAEVNFLPRSDLLEAVDDARSALQILGATPLAPFQPRDPAQALAAFFAAVEAGGSAVQHWQAGVAHDQPESFAPTFDHLSFAREVLESSRIPFEESPLTSVPLGQLIATASPTSLGALVGWVAAGNTPLLFIYVPAGIILVRCAVGLGRGLEEALDAGVKRFFTRRR